MYEYEGVLLGLLVVGMFVLGFISVVVVGVWQLTVVVVWCLARVIRGAGIWGCVWVLGSYWVACRLLG